MPQWYHAAVPQDLRNDANRIREILNRLDEHFPAAECALRHRNAFELLVATILSAQCTDERVNQVTPNLFAEYPDPEAMGSASIEQIQEIIRSTGFFRNKAKSIRGASRCLVKEFQGQVPKTMNELIRLPGVARKTANVVLGTWYGIAEGVVVDTHVKRISGRLGLTGQRDPGKIEVDLMERLPQGHWIPFSHQIIHHGRKTCKAQNPRCEECFLTDLCPHFLQVLSGKET